MREMKDSGVEWFGEIGADFELIKLKNVANILDEYRKPISADVRNQDAEVLYDYYGASGIIDKIDGYTIDDHVMLIGEDGANLLSRNLPLMYEVNGKAWINNHAHILKPKEETDFYYLFYVLESLDVTMYISGSAQPKLNQESLKNIYIPMPPYRKQRAIANYIYERSRILDRVIDKQQAIIEKLKEYKLSIITEKVSHGLNPCVSTKYSGNEFIGSIPSHWKCVKIKNVSIVVTDGAHVSPETENGVYDFISTVNVEQDHIDFDNCLKTTESSYQYLVSTGCRPLSGDVLISKDGSVGRTAIVNTDRDFVVSSSLVIIRPKIEMITSEFLNFNLQSAFVQETLLMLMHGAGLRRVSVNKNANLPVLLPPIEEQKDIVKYLEKKCSDIEKDITKRRKIVEELFMYKKSIIFEVVTGKKEI